MNKQLLELKELYEREEEQKEKVSQILSNIRVILFFAFVITLIIYGSTHSFAAKMIFPVFAIMFVVAVIYHNVVERNIQRIATYLDIIHQYEERSNGDWKNNQDDFLDSHMYFMSDLNIIGKNSLFRFLNFTNSLGGKNRLLDILSLKKVNREAILENQESITELKDKFEFALLFQEKMSEIKYIKNTDFKEYFYFFDKKRESKIAELIISLIISMTTIVIFLLGCFHILSFYYFVGLLFLQIISAYIYTSFYREEFDTISECVRRFKQLRDIYTYIGEQKFQSKKNLNLQQDIQRGTAILNKLIKISNLDSYRGNFITYIVFNVFFSLNFVILYQYIQLLNKETEDFKKSIISLEEFELLISLTTICFVKEKCVKPVIKSTLSLKVYGMRHPLLEEEKCVPNDFSCNKDMNIITGSNMSGKTSFMRTIGINLVLAYTGSYVNADTFSCPIMKIFTSINVKDDISNGISTFYGELQRIKMALDFSEDSTEPMILFIDEIFKGTNYNDRIVGAKEILKKLSSLNCIVFLTTHDFELCEINNKKIHNYHFSELYKQNKIYFDYKIKSGKCTTTNAKYLMKEMKIMD